MAEVYMKSLHQFLTMTALGILLLSAGGELEASTDAIRLVQIGWFPDSTAEAVTCTTTAVPVRSNYYNVQLLPNSYPHQAEVSIAPSPTAPDNIIVGANTDYFGEARQGYYYSFSAGHAWEGGDVIQGLTAPASDPAVCFDHEGNAYFEYAEGSRLQITLRRSINGGEQWETNLIDTVASRSFFNDKPHMTIDIQPASEYQGNIYSAWSILDPYGGDSIRNYSHRCVGFRRTTISDWPRNPDTIMNLSEGVVGSSDTLTLCQGVNLAVGPGGVLYAVWAIYDSIYFVPPNDDASEDAIGFTRSDDGGQTWEEARRIITVRGIRSHPSVQALPPKDMDVNSFPSLAVDSTGKIYVVWADKRYGDADILMISSTDAGDTWSDTLHPMRINSDDSGNGKDQWFPWIALDSAGGINVAFYDTRNDPENYFTEAWLARSTDSSSSFVNYRLSDVAFEPCVIRSSPERKYWGDYLGITATRDRVYAAWWDNERKVQGANRYKARVAVIPTTPVADTVASNSTWDMTTLISGPVVIPAGVTVTVAAGSKVLAASSGAAIYVGGSLVIEGGGVRPVFQCETQSAGDWGGIVVADGGSVDWGDGCLIYDASTAVTVEEGAQAMTISGVRVENCSLAGFDLQDSVKLLNDTVLGNPTEAGVIISGCDPTIELCHFTDCEYGIFAEHWGGKLHASEIDGPGQYGVYLYIAPESFGSDTASLIDVDIVGHFSAAHLYADDSASVSIDSCEFSTSIVDTVQSHFGIKARYCWIYVRHSQITNCDTAVYVVNCTGNLGIGNGSEAGHNSITTDTCSDSCAGSRVVAVCVPIEYGFDGPDPPGPICEFKAEGNWWGTPTPSSTWFTNVDYDPWLSSDTLLKPAPGSTLNAGSVAVAAAGITGHNYPNPFNPSTTIEFSLPTNGRTTIIVYNVLGQTVRVVADREFFAGLNRVVWDGIDNAGRQAASGIYFYLVTSGNRECSRKMILVR